MKNKKTLIWMIFLAALLAAAIWYLTRTNPVEVTLTEVKRGDVRASVANTRAGTVEACRRARLAPAMGGQIATLPVHEGDRVEADQVLLELWNVDLTAEVKLAKQTLIATRATADEVCVTADVAQREATRLTKLQARKLASEEAAERAVGDAESRAAACRAARQNIGVSTARVEVAQAALERTVLRAPFAGTVAEVNGEVGEFVTPSPVGIPTPPAVDLVDNSCLYIKAPIDEVDAPAIRTGMPARISLDAFPGHVFAGFVRRVAPYVLDIEKQARTVDIEAEIENPEEARLLPGYSADVEVILATAQDVLRIPAQAVLEGDKVFVYRGADGILEARRIEAGIRNWEHVQVISGVSEGDLIVTSVDREGVQDGAFVKSE